MINRTLLACALAFAAPAWADITDIQDLRTASGSVRIDQYTYTPGPTPPVLSTSYQNGFDSTPSSPSALGFGNSTSAIPYSSAVFPYIVPCLPSPCGGTSQNPYNWNGSSLTMGTAVSFITSSDTTSGFLIGAHGQTGAHAQNLSGNSYSQSEASFSQVFGYRFHLTSSYALSYSGSIRIESGERGSLGQFSNAAISTQLYSFADASEIPGTSYSLSLGTADSFASVSQNIDVSATLGPGDYEWIFESSAYARAGGAFFGLPVQMESGTASFGTTFSLTEIATPVPEPETYAMMLAGLGVLGAATRRRRQQET